MKKLKLSIVSGTNRANSCTYLIAKSLTKLSSLSLTEIEVLDLAKLPAEIFHPSSYSSKPQSFESWQIAVDTSDGIIFCVPEYNSSYPGILKYFIDQLRYPKSFSQKPIALVGLTSGKNDISGALAAMVSLMNFQKAIVYDKSIYITKCWEVVSSEFEIINTHTRSQMNELFTGFVQLCIERDLINNYTNLQQFNC